MQTAIQQRSFVASTTAKSAPCRQARVAVVARASEEGRRAVLGGLLAGLAVVTASPANAIDIIDDRKARAKGFDIIYEARDLDLPQGVRDGLEQARSDIGLTKKRIAESKARIDGSLTGYIEKKYWTEAREELRRQVGTLSFDLNTLAAQLPKAERKEAEALKKTFKSEVTALDYAIRKKDQASAVKELGDVKAALSSVMVKVSA